MTLSLQKSQVRQHRSYTRMEVNVLAMLSISNLSTWLPASNSISIAQVSCAFKMVYRLWQLHSSLQQILSSHSRLPLTKG